jgi:disulfide bond formation protein DsbB
MNKIGKVFTRFIFFYLAVSCIVGIIYTIDNMGFVIFFVFLASSLLFIGSRLEIKMPVVITKPEPYCPICGAKMVLKRPKPNQDWKPFWGCSQYPDCKGSRGIMDDGTPEDDYEEW